MSTPSDHAAFQYAELNKINSSLSLLRGLDLPGIAEARQALEVARINVLGKIGLVQPRSVSFITHLLGLSPGELNLFHDAELGWLVQITETPAAPVVTRYIEDELALKIITGELTHDDFIALSAPGESPDN